MKVHLGSPGEPGGGATALLDRPQRGGVLEGFPIEDGAFGDGHWPGDADTIIDRAFAGDGTLFGRGSGVSRGGGTCFGGDTDTFGSGGVLAGLPTGRGVLTA